MFHNHVFRKQTKDKSTLKQVEGLYRKIAWIFLILGIWIVIGFCIRLLRPHPHSTTLQLIIRLLLLGGIPITCAWWMFHNLRKEKRKRIKNK